MKKSREQSYHFGQLVHVPGHKRWIIRIIRGSGEAKNHSLAEGDLVIRGSNDYEYDFVHQQEMGSDVLVYVRDGVNNDLISLGGLYRNPELADKALGVLYIGSLAKGVVIQSIIVIKRLDAKRIKKIVLWTRARNC